MPNWCTNRLTITGPKADVEAFIEKAKGKELDCKGNPAQLSFDSIIPQQYDDPKYQNAKTSHVELNAEHPDFNWYQWRVDNWGVKWDLHPDEIGLETNAHLDDNTMDAVYEFTTAWCPPVQFYEKITAMYPALSFDAYAWEPGCSNWWMFFGECGEVVDTDDQHIDQAEKLLEAVKEKLSDMGYKLDSGDVQEVADNLSSWYLEEDDLTEMPEACMVIEDSDEDIAKYAKEAGFKKARKKKSK